MNGKRVGILVWLVAAAGMAFCQQVTRVAVVDLSKVIAACSKDSQSVRDFERKKSQVQTDIDKMSAEIMRLMSLKADADKSGDKSAALKYRDEIDKRSKALQDFVSTKQAELDADAKKLAVSDEFSQSLYKQIQNIAETEGYSMVINLKSSDSVMNAVLWYSPMIDITTSVIQSLTGGGQ
jgi:Skp family chaperone for outer membrane proteins